MPKPRIAVFSGPRSTIANSPTLVTSNKGRKPGERHLEGRFDHLIGQELYEPVKVKIKKYTAHPLEEESKTVYEDDGKDYWEIELRPDDGPYPLPYVARRANRASGSAPFEESDLMDPAMEYGGRQFFYPDASRIFADIDRTITGRDGEGDGNTLDRLADYDFIRALPPSGYASKGEKLGVDYFPYKPYAITKFPPAALLAKATNVVYQAIAKGGYEGAIWLEGSPHVEETTYWLSLLIDTDIPIVGVAAQRAHGQVSGDGDGNIVNAAEYVVSGAGKGFGGVGIVDEQVFAAREFKKGDDRPGGYKATGGHGGVLGTIGPPVTMWYRPTYKHTSTSDVRLSQLPEVVTFADRAGDTTLTSVQIKDTDGSLRGDAIPRVSIVKYAHYSAEDETENPADEPDIMARIERALLDESRKDAGAPQLHGLVLEGASPYGFGSGSQMAALSIAAYSGMPVVRVGRSDPGGRVPSNPYDPFIEGSNLDANKARMLLMAAMLKLGRLPKAKVPSEPTREERRALLEKVEAYQQIFETH